jgi:catechol-2,3-dioxygenase
MARINRVGHVVLNVSDTQASAQWYVDVLGMELMNYTPGLEMAFLSFGASDHDIALVKAPEGAELGSPGLSHTALALEGGEEELRQIYQKIKSSGAKIDFLADHGLSRSFYFFDPDGNRLEIFYQHLHGEEARNFMREAGAVLDAYELEPAAES